VGGEADALIQDKVQDAMMDEPNLSSVVLAARLGISAGGRAPERRRRLMQLRTVSGLVPRRAARSALLMSGSASTAARIASF